MSTTTPEYRLTFQTGVHQPPLHPVLMSVRRRFLDDTGNILISSQIQVFEQINVNFEAAPKQTGLDEKNRRTHKAHVLFRTGLANCLEAFVSSARDYYNKLVKIAEANPNWNIDDSPAWARYRTQELLDEQLSSSGVSGLTALDFWFRWACDGGPDFDRGEHGFSEPWCAPPWCWRNFRVSASMRKGGPDRLTAQLTRKVINSDRRTFDERLRNELAIAEDEARIELAVKRAESTVPTGASSKSDNEREDRGRLDKRVARKRHDPSGNPTMTVSEVAHAFSKSESTIYRWITEGKELGPAKIPLTWSESGRGRISTALVLRILPG